MECPADTILAPDIAVPFEPSSCAMPEPEPVSETPGEDYCREILSKEYILSRRHNKPWREMVLCFRASGFRRSGGCLKRASNLLCTERRTKMLGTAPDQAGLVVGKPSVPLNVPDGDWIRSAPGRIIGPQLGRDSIGDQLRAPDPEAARCHSCTPWADSIHGPNHVGGDRLNRLAAPAG